MSFKLVSDRKRLIGRAKDISPRDIDLILQSDGDRLSGYGFVQVAIARNNSVDARSPPGRQNPDFLANPGHARGDGAGKAAKGLVGPVHPLYGHAKRTVGRVLAERDRFEVMQERGAAMPRHCSARVHDIIAVERRERD
jgi:hypothetical protein